MAWNEGAGAYLWASAADALAFVACQPPGACFAVDPYGVPLNVADLQ